MTQCHLPEGLVPRPHKYKGRGTPIILQPWTEPDVSSRVKLPDYVTIAHEGGPCTMVSRGRNV